MDNNSKVLITGISGFIGRNLASYLSNKGYQIKGVDITPNQYFDTETIDLTQPISYLPDSEIIIHLAGNADVSISFTDPIRDFRMNVVATLNLLEYNRTHGNKPVIFASSYRVYPIPENGINKYRTDLEGVRSIYGCGKLSCELYLKEYHHLFKTTIVANRLSCVFGEGQKPNKQGWITLFIYNKLNELPIELSGDGKQVRDCLYIGDLARLIELEIQNLDRCSGKIYDIGGGSKNAFRLIDIVKFLDTEYPKYKPIEIKYMPEGRSFVSYISDLSEISWLWYPETSVWDGIRQTGKWLQNDKFI